MQATAYTGHGENTGGLQSHSIGELYPFDVYGQETPGGTLYGVIDLSSGAETGPNWSIAGATVAARAIKARAVESHINAARNLIDAFALAYGWTGRTKKVQP